MSDPVGAADPPSGVLYHYTSQEGLIGMLQSRKLHASDIRYLNDAQEFEHARAVSIEAAESLSVDPVTDTERSYVDVALQCAREVPNFGSFVFSMSEDGDLLSQWRGYCPNGQGFAIGFNRAKLRALAARDGFVLERCEYDGGRQGMLVKKLIVRGLEAVRSQQIPEAAEASSPAGSETTDVPPELWFINNWVRLAPTFKHPAFSEEREWRLVWQAAYVEDDARIKVKATAKGLRPYVELNLDADGRLDVIDEIRVGPTFDYELAERALHVLFEQHGVRPGVTIRSSSIPYRL